MSKYYLAVDCEGVACAVGVPGKGLSDGKNYEFACKQATLEANAASKALFEGGADEVYIWDAHGTGVNLIYDLLDERCKIVLGSGHKGRFPAIDASFAGVLFIGYHARSNTKQAVLAHTYCSSAIEYYKINGEEVGELNVDAAYAGAHGVPVLFCASDDKCIAQANALFPGIETVVTKQSLSWTSAISIHPAKACEFIYLGVQKALLRQGELVPYTLAHNLNVEIRYKQKEQALCAQHYDINGNPFEQKDDFTRSGVIYEISDLL